MSELNQSRLKNRYRCAAAEARLGTFCDVEPMSALPPKSDVCGATRDVRYGPEADIRHSFDHPVGGHEQTRRHGQAKRFRGFYVDSRFVFGRCLHRKVRGFIAAQDAIYIGPRQTKI